MHDETLYAERVLAAGARGYINKQEAQENIIKAIRQVLKGKVYLSQHMTDRLLSGMVDASGEKRDIHSLSNRELQVFELIGQGVTSSQMAEQLNLSVKTIETHQAHIKKETGPRFRTRTKPARNTLGDGRGKLISLYFTGYLIPVNSPHSGPGKIYLLTTLKRRI